MEAVLLVGIQGAGKTTFYRERFSETHLRISLDMVRTRRREAILRAACLEAGQRFVSDNTNVEAAQRARTIAPARAAGFRVVGFYFPPDVPGSLHRNELRSGRARIPAKGVLGTLRRLQPPRMDEGFDALFNVRVRPGLSFEVRPWDEARPC